VAVGQADKRERRSGSAGAALELVLDAAVAFGSITTTPCTAWMSRPAIHA
jgi:hypothetical protein